MTTSTENQQKMLIAEVRSMIILLDERLGDANPWRDIELDGLNSSELANARRLIHELLYAPPPRSR